MTSRLLLALAVASVVACGPPPEDRLPQGASKPVPCPPPPEPSQQSVVVGTIGKLHLAESRYPLTRLGDVLFGFKPDLILLAVRPEPFREGRLEDASFEMTYVRHLAQRHNVPVEPIDWFREQDLGTAPPPVEPWDAVEIAKRDASVLAAPKLLSFEQANGAPFEETVFFAMNAEVRNRAGNPSLSRRQAWVAHLAGSAVTRHGKPKRVLAFVDVFDRPNVDFVLRGMGYAAQAPADIVQKSKEAALPEVPHDLIAEYQKELERARAHAEKSEGVARTFWAERAHVLSVVVEQKAACCVSQAALTAR